MKVYRNLLPASLFILMFYSCQKTTEESVEEWSTVEISLDLLKSFDNPYTEVEAWAEFTSETGEVLIRPAFWNGGEQWMVRFAPPKNSKTWTWKIQSKPENIFSSNLIGKINVIPYSGTNKLLQHGLLKMSPGKRNVIHADGSPFLVVGDTPWAIPFRATKDQVEIYAADRKDKGFNTALLMTVQPDQFAEGPEGRNIVEGFDRGFEDLSEGHINKIKPDYFQYLDTLIAILRAHEIVPAFQPVFQGFGWKGKSVLGTSVDPGEYARFCRYLVARYGSGPAFWLVSGDGTGRDPAINPAGKEVEKWDSYQQPAGIHYNPADDYLPDWANGDSTKAFHYNKIYQDEKWLDFQWAQTGHDGIHMMHKVERMYENKPVKANLNGEPTYEGMNNGQNGLGWWQGHEAWSQMMHGGTMGVVYGAVGLWQWKITPDEPGWGDWTNYDVSWREALDFEGSNYVGFVGKALEDYDITDMEKRWDLTNETTPLLAKEEVFYLSYLENGGTVEIKNLPDGLPYHWFNPKTGDKSDINTTVPNQAFQAPSEQPWVLIIGKKISALN